MKPAADSFDVLQTKEFWVERALDLEKENAELRESRDEAWRQMRMAEREFNEVAIDIERLREGHRAVERALDNAQRALRDERAENTRLKAKAR